MLGVRIDDWGSLCPDRVDLPHLQPYAPPPQLEQAGDNDGSAANARDPICALVGVRTHWEAWYKSQQETIAVSLESQRSAIAPIHEGVLPAIDALAELIPWAEGSLKNLHDKLDTARYANEVGSPSPAEAGQVTSECDRLEREVKSAEQMLGFVRETVAGLRGLCDKIMDFQRTIDGKLAAVRA